MQQPACAYIRASLIVSSGPGSAARQATALRREGVTVDTGSLGIFTVDFNSYGWFPDILPSEEADASESDAPVAT